MKTTPKIYSLLLVLLLLVAASSCSNKDDDNNPPPEPTVAELLAHKWFFFKREVNGTVHLADACTKQTYLDFKSDGSFTFQEFDYDNNQNCINSPVTLGAYTLSSDETKIMVIGAFGDQTLTINSISETELVLTFMSGEIITLKREL